MQAVAVQTVQSLFTCLVPQLGSSSARFSQKFRKMHGSSPLGPATHQRSAKITRGFCKAEHQISESKSIEEWEHAETDWVDMTPRLTSLANARPKTGNDNIIGGRMPTYPNQAMAGIWHGNQDSEERWEEHWRQRSATLHLWLSTLP